MTEDVSVPVEKPATFLLGFTADVQGSVVHANPELWDENDELKYSSGAESV